MKKLPQQEHIFDGLINYEIIHRFPEAEHI